MHGHASMEGGHDVRDPALGLVVEGGRGLIEHEHRGFPVDRPGDADSLSLPPRQARTPLANVRVEALGQPREEGVELGTADG